MAEADPITATVHRYWDTFSAGDRAGWLGCFAEGAWIEDPVGTPRREGTAAIGEFFDQSQGVADRITLRGRTLQVCGSEAAFSMEVRPVLDGTEFVLEAIDVMTFDDEARITSMRAFFDPSAMRPAG